MGETPAETDDAVILNGTFDNADHWNWIVSWGVAGGKAVYLAADLFARPIFQINVNYNPDRDYTVTFTMSDVNFDDPADGLRVLLGGNTDGVIYKAGGTHQAVIASPGSGANFAFVASAGAIGDTCKVDNVSITPVGSYILSTLQINWPKPRRYEGATAVGAEFQAILASRNGKTNCGILYNIP